MKKILFHLFLLASLFMAACHDDNGGPSSIVIDKDQQNQTAYADDTEKTIRFEATEAWHTEVDYTATKATETVEKWVSLDPASGEAGEITIKLALSTNYTGTDRKATIHIICGGTTITVIIEQKGEYTFLYSIEDIDKIAPIKIDVKQEKLKTERCRMKILRPMEYVKSLKSLLPPTANRITSYLPTMNKDVYKNTHCIKKSPVRKKQNT